MKLSSSILVLWLISLPRVSDVCAGDDGAQKVIHNDLKTVNTSEAISLDLLLYLSNLTAVQGDLVGPLDMLNHAQYQKEGKAALTDQKKPVSTSEQSEKVQ